MKRTTIVIAAGVAALGLAGCSGPDEPDPQPEPTTAAATGAPVSETCDALYDPTRSPIEGVRATLPMAVVGIDNTVARAAYGEIEALLDVVEKNGSEAFGESIDDLQLLYTTAQGGSSVSRAEVDAVVDEMDALCDPAVVNAAGWTSWPN